MNQLTTVGGVSAGHDARGNVTTDPTTGNSYGYSSENLLTSGTAGTSSYALTYDPLARLASISGAPATGFGYDGLDMIDESQNGAIVTHHVFDPDTGLPLVTQYGTSSHLFLSPDERGSIVASTGDSGSLLYGNPYDEFGRTMPWSTFRYLYTGQAWINELGLSYYKARMYSPKLGRFLQTDPIGYEDSPNLYAYVLDDPVNNADPFGLSCDLVLPGEAQVLFAHCPGDPSPGLGHWDLQGVLNRTENTDRSNERRDGRDNKQKQQQSKTCSGLVSDVHSTAVLFGTGVGTLALVAAGVGASPGIVIGLTIGGAALLVPKSARTYTTQRKETGLR